MKIDAVGVTSSNLKQSMAFYTCLGFEFPELEDGQDHIEPLTPPGSARIMLDTAELAKDLLGEAPRPANHSSFAIRFDKPEEIDAVCQRVIDANFKVSKEPWDAFWGQRYAVVQDPDGYSVDLYCPLDQ